MLDPSDLLAVARLLFSASSTPSQSQLRRAVSTVYYAVFHTVLRAGAERFMGAGTEGYAGYSLIYRGYNHGRMRSVCEALTARTLTRNLQQQLRRTAVSQDVRDFAEVFMVLQDRRFAADYDPAAVFAVLDVEESIKSAEVAIAAFDRIAPAERADILALMLVNPRA